VIPFTHRLASGQASHRSTKNSIANQKKSGDNIIEFQPGGVPGKDGEMKRKSTIIMVVLAAVLSLMPSVILAQSEEAEVSFSLENDLPESIREPFTEESLMEAIEMGGSFMA
jgi:hypothetical protein